MTFWTQDGAPVPAVTATQMRQVDHIAVQEFGLGLLQMMENAGRNYSLHGAPRGRAAELIDLCNRHAARVLSLDVPSGLDATTGAAPGLVMRPERTLTLALPKTGLHSIPGDLYLADIGIPPQVYDRLANLSVGLLFEKRYWISLQKAR
jgi:NAD(P)H-hydrate repair Nnr-like enzyme with NAD(P)H-hydrate epimerase domain